MSWINPNQLWNYFQGISNIYLFANNYLPNFISINFGFKHCKIFVRHLFQVHLFRQLILTFDFKEMLFFGGLSFSFFISFIRQDLILLVTIDLFLFFYLVLFALICKASFWSLGFFHLKDLAFLGFNQFYDCFSVISQIIGR